MRKVALILLAFTCLHSCKTQTSENGNDNTSNNDSTVTTSDEPVADNNYYKRYKGTIANVPVVLNLVKSGDQYRGSYYYEKIGNVLGLYGMSKPDSTGLFHFGEHSPTERGDRNDPKWLVTMADSTIIGTWESGDKKKSYNINLKEDYEGALKLTVLYSSDSMRYRDTMPAPFATCRLQYILPTEGDTKSQYLSKALGDLLACPIVTKDDFELCLNKKKDSYYSTYLADLKDAEEQDLLADSYSFNFAWIENYDVCYNSRDWLCICVVDWQYTGGAHGNYNSSYHCIDLMEEKLWKLKDVVASPANLVSLIEKDVRKQFDLSDRQALNSRLFVDEMYATDNFFVTDKGITFIYTSYEIASYADGEVSVFIPFAKMMKWLTPNFKQRMGLINNTKKVHS